MTGWTSAVSDNGCHVRAAEALAAGTIVQVRIEWDGKAFETWARVADAVPLEGMGLAFFDTTQAQREILRSWIEKEGVKDGH